MITTNQAKRLIKKAKNPSTLKEVDSILKSHFKLGFMNIIFNVKGKDVKKIYNKLAKSGYKVFVSSSFFNDLTYVSTYKGNIDEYELDSKTIYTFDVEI